MVFVVVNLRSIIIMSALQRVLSIFYFLNLNIS